MLMFICSPLTISYTTSDQMKRVVRSNWIFWGKIFLFTKNKNGVNIFDFFFKMALPILANKNCSDVRNGLCLACNHHMFLIRWLFAIEWVHLLYPVQLFMPYECCFMNLISVCRRYLAAVDWFQRNTERDFFILSSLYLFIIIPYVKFVTIFSGVGTGLRFASILCNLSLFRVQFHIYL